MANARDLVSAATLIIATAALVVGAMSLMREPVPGAEGPPGPRGPPGEVLYLPSWPPPPCEPNCSWHPVRTFTQSGGTTDTVNITGSEVKAAWSVISGDACDAFLSVTFRHLDGPDAGTDLLYWLVQSQPGSHSDTFTFPTGAAGGVGPGAYAVTVGASNTCGGGWTWSVAIQEWR